MENNFRGQKSVQISIVWVCWKTIKKYNNKLEVILWTNKHTFCMNTKVFMS
jgi:hypothetical protein